MFSPQEVIGLALLYYKNDTKSAAKLPTHCNWLDIATYPYPYDYDYEKEGQTKGIHNDKFSDDPSVRRVLLRERVDSHD